MPYIAKKDRKEYDEYIRYLLFRLLKQAKKNKKLPVVVGDLNYIISSLVWEIFETNPSYTNGNNLIGVLECVKQEFYRRKLSPYEDKKIEENGDIQ